jgi:hypothetical protein
MAKTIPLFGHSISRVFPFEHTFSRWARKGSRVIPFLQRGRSWPCRKEAVFPAFFENGVIFSPRYIRVFSELFLESENVFHGEASFSRRKRGFLDRLFADGQVHLFVIII